ncbi:hypothetical protein [Methanolobus psychrotolerans]|nr:hypothetical protein [Methanolobus psychrotolerans]
MEISPFEIDIGPAKFIHAGSYLQVHPHACGELVGLTPGIHLDRQLS